MKILKIYDSSLTTTISIYYFVNKPQPLKTLVACLQSNKDIKITDKGWLYHKVTITSNISTMQQYIGILVNYYKSTTIINCNYNDYVLDQLIKGSKGIALYS